MIVFLDVLGQSDTVLGLPRIPITEEEKIAAAEILDNTAGHILKLRSYFDSFNEAREKPTGILDKLPPEQRKIAEQMRSVKAEWRGLSDSIVITVPLANDNEHCTPMSSILFWLFGVCTIFVVSLVSKKPLRGGVDIGWGVQLNKDEVYGSALVKAVKLESEDAQYPRVIVGDSIWKYINSVEKLEATTILGQMAKKNAETIKSLITTDSDGKHILDVIGSSVHDIGGGITPEFVKSSYEFIVETHNHLNSVRDTKLSPRYNNLRSYFESRLHIWDIQPAKG